MNRYDTDVIVVGAGPAGATAARWLAVQGVSVLLLERQRLPRYKPCGGALTKRTLQLLSPLNVSPVVEEWVNTLTVQAPDGDRFTLTLPEPLIATVMRDRFDAFLTDAATAAGAKLRCAETVTRCELASEGVIVTTNLNAYRCRVLIGADGANSVVAQQFGLKPKRRAVSLVSELLPEALLHWDGSIHLLFPPSLNGYGWCFPKGDHLSVGIYTMLPTLPDWQTWLSRYLTLLQFTPYFHRSHLHGHPVPLADRHAVLHRGNALVIGDAAGLVDPFTGEGISWAVQSGRMVAETVRQFLDGEIPDLRDYTLFVRKELLPELRAAEWFARITFTLPNLACHWFLRHEAVLRNFAKLLSGEVSYKTLWRKTLHKGFVLLHRRSKSWQKMARQETCPPNGMVV